MRYDDVFGQLQEALETGRVDRRDVEKLIERGGRGRPADTRAASARPGIGEVLAAAGALVVYLGFALLYVLQWHDLHGAVRTLSPFLFPAAALAAAIALHRANRPAWESELAGLVGYVALALAFLAAAVSFDPADGGRFGLLAGVLGTCVVVGMHLVLRNVRLTGWGLSIALVAVTGSAAAVVGADRDATGWVLLAQAAVAALTGGFLVQRSREAAAAAFRTALILTYMAAVAGGADVGYGHLSGWLLVISLSVVATFVLAVSLGFDGMIWIGVAGSLVWLAMSAAAIGSSAGWAFALVLVGLGLVALSVLVNALRSRRITIG